MSIREKRNRLFCISWMATVLGLVWVTSFAAAESKEHTVVYGDTLWDLAGRYYEDPWGWPRLWKANPSVKSPHLIYPGQRLQIVEEKAKAPAPVEEAPAEAIEVVKEPEVPAAVPPPLPLREPVHSVARRATDPELFLAPADWRGEGTIVEDPVDKLMISLGDLVFVDVGVEQGVAPGQQLTVYRKLQKVRHPRTGKRLGVAVQQVGLLKIEGEPRGALSTARVVFSHGPLQVGDLVRIQRPEVP
ncbi:MAG: LysM peptidoglycan-binding domain-containing protein [Elusimicrobia bacterium]|nr:LysM peptidoglycan-binding domain-containing protein [Elusimicrobiota bacterium]